MSRTLFVAISDVHICLKHLEVSLQVLRTSLEHARSKDVPLVIAGDLNDTKAVMRSEWVKALIQLFKEFADVRIHVLVGNHDLNNKNSSSHSLEFLQLLENVKLHDQPTSVSFMGVEFDLIPYMVHKEDFLEAINGSSVSKVICHQGFMGAFMGDYVVDESSVDPKELKDKEIVLSGHYHKHQWVGDNIMYFGSPYTVNFGEHLQSKFYWEVEEVGEKIHPKPIMTDVRRHIQLVWDGVMPSGDGLSHEPCYGKPRSYDLVKVILKGTKEFCLGIDEKVVRDYLGCENITLVPEIISQSEHRISADIVHDPVQVIKQYLENAETIFDKKKLEELLFSQVQEVLRESGGLTCGDVKIIETQGQNFLSFQEFRYEYSSGGLTLIEGHDEDRDISTGAGKSSFLDAPCYGLFGKTSKDMKVDEVINRQAGKGLSVITRVMTAEGECQVHRYRKHPEHENDLFMTLPDGTELRGKDNRETQQLIEAFLGINFDTFTRLSYFTQFGAMDRFLSSSDTDKKKLISEITDTAVYDRMTDKVKEELKKAQEKLDGLVSNEVSQASAIQQVRQHIEQLKAKAEQFQIDKANAVANLEKAIEEWEEHKKQRILDLRDEAQAFEVKKETRILELRKQSHDFRNEQQRQIVLAEEEILDLSEKALELEEKIKPVPCPDQREERTRINHKLEIIKQLEQKLSELNGQVHYCDKQKKSIEGEIAVAQSRKSEAQCSFCHQPISGEKLDVHVAHLNSKIQSLDIERQGYRHQIEEIRKSLSVKERLQEQVEALDKQMSDYRSREQMRDQLKAHYDQTLARMKRLEEEKHNQQADPYLPQIEQVKQEENHVLQKIGEVELEVNPHHERLAEAKCQPCPYSEMVQSSETDQANKIKALEELKKEIEEVRLQVGMGLWWKEALHVYIKSYLMDSFLEQINQIANEYLKEMFDGILTIDISAQGTTAKGKTKEKITVTIYNENDQCSYNSLSGGERTRICFALNLALARVIRKTTGKSFNFIMFDEVLNGLDEVGKSQVMRVFKQLEAEYETVFVIDHTTEFKGLFTNSIMVRKSGGVSSLV